MLSAARLCTVAKHAVVLVAITKNARIKVFLAADALVVGSLARENRLSKPRHLRLEVKRQSGNARLNGGSLMKINYTCTSRKCHKQSILTAIHTAEPRVCQWCGATINPKHVERQSREPFPQYVLGPITDVMLGSAISYVLFLSFSFWVTYSLQKLTATLPAILQLWPILLLPVFFKLEEWRKKMVQEPISKILSSQVAEQEAADQEAADQK